MNRSRGFLKPNFGKIPLSQLRTPMVQKFYNRLRDERRSPKYIKNIHGIFHRALDMAVRVEYLQRNPSSACILPKVVEKPVTPLDIPEQKRFFAALKGNRFEALFLTAVFTGMRVGEIIGLTWDCVDFEHGVIRVEKQLIQTRVKGTPLPLTLPRSNMAKPRISKRQPAPTERSRLTLPKKKPLTWLKMK